MNSFLGRYQQFIPNTFTSTWEAPSNIAFVKYWGKRGQQIPANPSLSMTLKECKTQTKSTFQAHDKLEVELFLNGHQKPVFAQKIHHYLTTLSQELPWLNQLHIKVETHNTFPHSAGIASSASGMAAFALTFADFLNQASGVPSTDEFYRQASFLARLASGSACRSLYGGFTSWGHEDLHHPFNLYATPVVVHESMYQLCDTVVVVSGEEKSTSSRSGHQLMMDHPFAQARLSQASTNQSRVISYLQEGNFESLGPIIEAEALTLHSLMMTSSSPYILLKPNTLKAIEAIWLFRQETRLPVYFTLDAGPNLHLIYPDSYREKIYTFISNELRPFSELIIDDKVGEGPVKC